MLFTGKNPIILYPFPEILINLSRLRYFPKPVRSPFLVCFILRCRQLPHTDSFHPSACSTAKDSAYRKFHGCDTALLCLTENWKRELDNQKIVGLVSMDLSKAFDMLPHELIMNKLRQFADEDTCRLLESYLTGRRQRVKLGGEHSSWQPITKGIPRRAPTVQHLHE